LRMDSPEDSRAVANPGGPSSAPPKAKGLPLRPPWRRRAAGPRKRSREGAPRRPAP
jgi:hypothetical protein